MKGLLVSRHHHGDGNLRRIETPCIYETICINRCSAFLFVSSKILTCVVWPWNLDNFHLCTCIIQSSRTVYQNRSKKLPQPPFLVTCRRFGFLIDNTPHFQLWRSSGSPMDQKQVVFKVYYLSKWTKHLKLHFLESFPYWSLQKYIRFSAKRGLLHFHHYNVDKLPYDCCYGSRTLRSITSWYQLSNVSCL